VLSIGIFFTLMIIGLAATLPHALTAGLEANGVAGATASQVGHLPPISVLFASFLGYSPAQSLIDPHVLRHLSTAHRAAIQGHAFFPSLISAPFRDGLHQAFTFATAICLAAALTSWSRGARTSHEAAPQEVRARP
jgi:hypothetical protein